MVTWKWWGSRCRTRALGAIVVVGALWELLRVVVVRNKTFHVDDRGFDGGFAEVGGSVRYGLQVRYSGMVRVTRVTLSGTCRMNQLRFADFRSFCWTPFFLPRESSSCLTLLIGEGSRAQTGRFLQVHDPNPCFTVASSSSPGMNGSLLLISRE